MFNYEVIELATKRAKAQISKYLSTYDNFIHDKLKTERLRTHLCRACFYHIVGFSNYYWKKNTCRKCKQEFTHRHPVVGMFCLDCAKKFGICRNCASNVNI